MNIQNKNRLKEARFFQGLTQFRLGRLASINSTKLSLLENGDVDPSEDEKIRLSRALGMKPSELFPEER
jgi:transcriptional regulator with XRE-family HTH domain